MTKRSVVPKIESHLPQVDKILREPALEQLAQTVKREIIAQAVRLELARLREAAETDATAQAVAESVKNQINNLLKGGIKRVVNGTGVILSTNLGRAPLSTFAVERLSQALSSYSNLEFDLHNGERGERTAHLSLMLTLLTGCQSAIVVNNCAAAVMLAVHALSRGKEVIVSRGELIEIGGSFRLPDVIAASGGILKEVGTTNRTRLSDYKNALSANTGLILKCHRSNYQILGFTEDVSAEELAALSKESKIPLAYDLGGGCFVDLRQYDLAPEPTVQATLATGVGLVMFSGDKLLGGPQAGIIAGQKQYVSQLRNCPIYRTLRADKLVLALLETVISQYLVIDGPDKLPVFCFAALKAEVIEERVHLFIGRMKDKLSGLEISPKEMTSTMGGGSLPGESLPSYGVALKAKAGTSSRLSDSKLAKLLRQADPPVVSTIAGGLVMLDFRTIKEGDEEDLAQVLINIDQSIK
jgi:L-seryl-tRNA(Ser) seleniumtransferase